MAFTSESELKEYHESGELDQRRDKKSRKHLKGAIVFGKPFHAGSLEELKEYPGGRIDYTIRLNLYTIETRGNFPRIQFPGPSDGMNW